MCFADASCTPLFSSCIICVCVFVYMYDKDVNVFLL